MNADLNQLEIDRLNEHFQAMAAKEMKPVKCGLGYALNKSWQPVKRSRKGAQQLADRMARKPTPKHFWHGSVCDCGSYYRISIGGQIS